MKERHIVGLVISLQALLLVVGLLYLHSTASVQAQHLELRRDFQTALRQLMHTNAVNRDKIDRLEKAVQK